MDLPFKPDYSEKVAVVTGGAGVLCREFCKALAMCGAKVAVLNRTLSRAEAVVEEIKAMGGEAAAFAVNVTDRESVSAAHAAVLAKYGRCSILINGAGGNDPAATTDDEFFSIDTMKDEGKKSFFDLPMEGFSKVFDLNILGTLIPTQEFAKDMVENEHGVILNISSMNAFTPLTKIPAPNPACLTLLSGLQCTLQSAASASMRSRLDSSPLHRTQSCCGMTTARPPRAPAR